MTFVYPKARRDDTVKEDHFGIEVKDPYRWLEDPDSEETKNFVKEQNEISKKYVESYKYRDKIREKYTKYFNFPKIDPPIKVGSVYFQFKNSGLQNQSVLYKLKTLSSEPELFLDPNTFAEDGTVALTATSFSKSGKFLAYATSSGGSDWISIHFISTDGVEYTDKLNRLKFTTPTWLHDDSGVLYSAYLKQEGEGTETVENKDHRVYFHKIGTAQSEDIEIAAFEDPHLLLTPKISDCGKYVLIFSAINTDGTAIHVSSIKEDIGEKLILVPIVTGFENEYDYLTNNDSKFIFKTNKDNPNYRVIIIDLNNPLEENWVELIAEDSNCVLCDAQPISNDKLVLVYMKDVTNFVTINSLETGDKLMDVPVPLGSISYLYGEREHKELFFHFTSFTTPGCVYKIDFTEESMSTVKIFESKIGKLDYNNYDVKQIFYESKDKQKIPMFLYYRKGLVCNGKNPCYMFAYGGFNYSITPHFSVRFFIWVTYFNGVFALPNIRGGGEYGKKWNEAGMLLNKKNCFDDFEYAAKYLITNNYTNSSILMIEGGSNGGLLMGAVINQSPQLYAAAHIAVGVMDMLRFNKFTVGKLWMGQFGDPDTQEHFEYIYSYSPLHNIREPSNQGQYPAILVTTADHDDRVVPLHSYKYIAELQYKIGVLPQQTNPLLAMIDTKAGHGAGMPTAKIIEKIVDIFCFAGKTMGIPFGKQCYC